MTGIAAVRSFLLKPTGSLPMISQKILVLGSGPGSKLPNDFDSSWTLVTVNASQVAPAAINIKPSVTLIGASTLRSKPSNKEAKNVLKGLATKHLILFERGRLLDKQRYKLLKLHYVYESVAFIPQSSRSGWVEAITGSADLEKPSNGVALAFMCVALGAKSVVLTGFSLSKAGHVYNDKNRERAHVEADKIALRLAVERGHPLFTNQPEFSNESGLPLYPQEV